MEASSHGLDQFRLDGVRLAAGGVHQPDARPPRLSRLGGRLPGRQAAAVRRAAAGGRAGGGEQRHGCRRRSPRWPMSRRGGGSIFARSARPDRRSVCWRPNRVPTDRFCASTPAGVRREVMLPLPGRFQADNALMAAALAAALGERDVLDRLRLAARRARPAGTGGAPAERRRGLCRLRAHARRAGAAADRAAPAHRRAGCTWCSAPAATATAASVR